MTRERAAQYRLTIEYLEQLRKGIDCKELLQWYECSLCLRYYEWKKEIIFSKWMDKKEKHELLAAPPKLFISYTILNASIIPFKLKVLASIYFLPNFLQSTLIRLLDFVMRKRQKYFYNFSIL